MQSSTRNTIVFNFFLLLFLLLFCLISYISTVFRSLLPFLPLSATPMTIHISVYTCAYTCLYMHTHVHKYTYIHKHRCMHFHIHIHKYIHIHTNRLHDFRQTCGSSSLESTDSTTLHLLTYFRSTSRYGTTWAYKSVFSLCNSSSGSHIV